jgi:hypothetical protein
MIADDWNKKIMPNYPWADPLQYPYVPGPTKEEFEALKKELEELKERLKEGKKQDEEEGNPDCEMEEKIELLRQLGELMGVNLEEVFKDASQTSSSN